MNHLPQLPSCTPAECARLSVYKAAVAVGLYRDAVAEDSGSYRFSASELARLVVHRPAVAAGFYTDQLADDAAEMSPGG